MPLQATSGAASYDAFGGGVPVVPTYIEDIFSCFLYTGNGSTQTITNGIDLAGKGGMVWIKSRTSAAGHALWDTARTPYYYLVSNATSAEQSVGSSNALTSYNADGFTVTGGSNAWNGSQNYVSWTFRKAPKFFDVVTYSGSSSTQNIAHNLGSVPGCIIVKRTSGVEDWFVYHTSLGNTQYIKLNSTSAAASGFAAWNNTSPTSTQFTVLGGRTEVNAAGSTYVAYLFAHNAGGFGLTGTDNVISCGSFTTDGSGNATVSLGYEPQWLLSKGTSAGNDWFINDNMRGLSYSNFAFLNPNSSSAETNLSGDYLVPNATGFTAKGFSGSTTFIYIAIRRGPMKVPTSGTSVFSPYTATLSAGTTVNAGLTPDLLFAKYRPGTDNPRWVDRLRGFANATGGTNPELYSNETSAESTSTAWSYNWNNTGYVIGNALNGLNSVIYAIKRAPSFFDEVCYTGNSVAGRTLTHNLGVVPQLIILKARTIDVGWAVYAEPAGNTKYSELNDVTRFTTGINCWNDTSPTASVFSLSSNARVNRTGDTYVAYLFATCAGVSKVGSYTGTGSLQTINCGFTSGARFVLIKNQNVNGDWYVWDSARGISSSNDPYLLLNSTAAEVTNTNYVDTDSTGFKVTGNTAINTSSDTYIFLAIA